MALDNEKLTERPALTNSQDTDIIHVVRGNVSYQKEAQNFNAGSISSLNDVGNVNAPSPQTGNFLKWDTANSKWIAQEIYLNDLADVDASSPTDGQVLAWNNTDEEWEATTIPTASVGGADTQVQYNDSGSFGAGAFFTTDKSSKIEVTNEIGLIGDGATAQGLLKLYCENGNAHFVGIKGPNHLGGSSYTLQLPNALPNVTNQILESNESGELSWINTPSNSATFTGLTDTPANYICQDGKNVKVAYTDTGSNPTELEFVPDYFDFACSDEDSDLAVGIVFTMICNRAYSLVSAVEFSVTTAPTGADLVFDFRKNGTSWYTTNPTIDAGEKLTATSSVTPVTTADNISFAIGDELQVRITQVGSTVAGKGLKATMIYNDRQCP